MTVIEDFIDRWQRLQSPVGGLLSLPTRAAMAAADTLPGVRGAAICLYDSVDARLAIGVSDPQALLAEQLEYTIGDGPGLHAQRSAAPAVAGEYFARLWPIFREVLLSRTPFRAVRAVPLGDASTDWSATLLLYYYAAIDLYAAAPADISEVAEAIACAVACSMTELAVQLRMPDGGSISPHITQRLGVSVATGMVTAAHQLIIGDALDVLRGYAYAHDQTVDHTARQLTTGQLHTRSI